MIDPTQVNCVDVSPTAIRPGSTNQRKQKKEGERKAMSVKQTNPDIKGRAVNVGVDVPKRSWRVTALLEAVVLMAGCVRDATRKGNDHGPGADHRSSH